MPATLKWGFRLAVLLFSTSTATAQVIGCKNETDPRTGRTIYVGPVLTDAFARMQVDSAFAGIRTSDTQRNDATRVVRKAMEDVADLQGFGQFSVRNDSTATWTRRIMDNRNAALGELLTSGNDRSRLKSNLVLMSRSANRCENA